MSPTLPFKDKIALITGSGRGIGRAIALHFARNGADVIVNFFRNRATAENTVSEIKALGRKALLVRANVGNLDDLERMFDQVDESFGALNFFISNAASGYNRPVMEQKPRGWEWSININARALLFAAQRAVPLMEVRGGGAIVSISSPGSFRVMPDYVVVGASKAAQESIIRYLAVELGSKNIIANAVSPGVVQTDALQHFDVLREDQHLIDRIASLSPAKRLVSPEDVANVVAFLCTPEAQMIRGQTIIVDGGYSLPVRGV
jgi:enoyl-[acyl-carrier protein] reductase III